VAVREVADDDQIFAITHSGMILRMGCKGISKYGRATQGVRLMTLDESDRVVAVATVPREERQEDLAIPVLPPQADADGEDDLPPLDVEMPAGEDLDGSEE